jgi:CheY-like chemotaxis protein
MASEDRVLLVDDQPMMGEVVKRILGAAGGIELRVVTRPDEALAAAREFAPTVILQDVEMPGINGFELLDAYRADADLAVGTSEAPHRADRRGHDGEDGRHAAAAPDNTVVDAAADAASVAALQDRVAYLLRSRDVRVR